MEFSEVVNPQFAFPVFGVVICAFLVFAFGFKSSVQPPSFDFSTDDDTDKRHRKQKRTKKPTGTINGHIPVANNNVVVTQRNTSKSLPQATKTVESPSQKSKDKTKRQTTPKASVKLTVAMETPVGVDTDSGEWTTALSKKDKKLRSKEKREEEPEVISEPETVPEPDQQVKEASPVIESQKNQKKKEKRIKKGAKDIERGAGDGDIPLNQDQEEVEPVTEPVTKPKEIPTKEKEPVKLDNKPSSPTKKKKNDTKLSPEKVTEKVVSDKQNKKKDEKKPAATSEASPSDNIKTEKSPKKKKKSPSPALKEEAAKTDNISNGHIADQVVEPLSQDIKKGAFTQPLEKPVANGASDDSSKPAEAAFDEIGDQWVEAKAPRKKKKARKDV